MENKQKSNFLEHYIKSRKACVLSLLTTVAIIVFVASSIIQNLYKENYSLKQQLTACKEVKK